MHACSSSYTRQQNERLVHARVQFPMVIRHRSVVRTRKMLRAFLKTCRAVQLLHACVVKFKVSGTVAIHFLTANNAESWGTNYGKGGPTMAPSLVQGTICSAANVPEGPAAAAMGGPGDQFWGDLL